MKTTKAKLAISSIGDVVSSLGRVDPMDFYRGMRDCSSSYQTDLNSSDRPYAIQSLQVSRHIQMRKEQTARLYGVVQN